MATEKKSQRKERPGDARFYDNIPFDLVRPATGSEDYKDGWEQAAFFRPRLLEKSQDWQRGYDDCQKAMKRGP